MNSPIPELSGWRSASEARSSDDMVRNEDEQLAPLAHLLEEDGSADLAARVDLVAEARRAVTALEARFSAFDDEAPESDLEALIEDWLVLVRPVAEALEDVTFRAPQASALPEQLDRRSLNPVQHRIVGTLQERLAAPKGP